MELLISVAIGSALIEAYAWLPCLCHWLLGRAVSIAPIDEQERCRDEWTTTLEALPNSAIRLLHALSLVLIGAPRIRSDYREQTLEELDSLLPVFADFESDLQRTADSLTVRLKKFASDGEQIESKVSLSMRELLRTIAHVSDGVARNNRLPPKASQDLTQTLARCTSVTEAQTVRLLHAFKRKTLSEYVEQLIHVTENAAQMAGCHRLVFDALRAPGQSFREWEAALDAACNACRADIDAFSEWIRTHQAQDNGEDDVDCDWAEFNSAFGEVKATIATLRSQMSQTSTDVAASSKRARH